MNPAGHARGNRPFLIGITVVAIAIAAVVLVREGAEPVARLAQSARALGAVGVLLFVLA